MSILTYKNTFFILGVCVFNWLGRNTIPLIRIKLKMDKCEITLLNGIKPITSMSEEQSKYWYLKYIYERSNIYEDRVF